MKKIILGVLLLASGLLANAQFTQNFDGAAALPAGWSIINQGSANGWGVSAAIVGDAHSGTNAAQILYDSEVAHNDYLISPQITVTAATNDRYSFWIKSRSESYLEPYEVLLSTTNTTAAAFSVVLQASQEAAASWVKKQFDLTPYVGQSVYIAIRATGTNEYELYVDDVVSDALPACGPVSNLVAGTMTPTSTQFSWSSNATSWQYFLGDTSDETPVDAEAVAAGTNPFTIEGLSSGTVYKVWFRSNCNGSFGDWSDPVTFTTPCVAATIPTVVQGFETTADGELPTCWTNNLVSGENNWVVTTPAGDISTTASGDKIIFKNYNTSEALLFSPALDYAAVTEATRVNVWLHRHASADAGDKYVIYANTTASLTGATQIYEQFSKTTSAPAVPSTGFYNYKLDIPATFNGQAQVFIIIRGITTAGFSSYAIGVDDFRVEYTPGCAEVETVEVSNIGAHQVDINWSASSSSPANGYEYALSTSPASPDTAEFSGTIASGLTATVTELAANTMYYVWVRSVCSATDNSPWSNAISFTTICDPIAESSLPWTEGFESLSTTGSGNFPGCWFSENSDWATANAATSDNDYNARTGNNFLTESWSATNEFIWTPGFELTAGSNYDFSFWFNGFGDYSTWEGSVVVNGSQSSVGATQVGQPFATAGTSPPNAYTLVNRSFVPTTSGIYYFGLKVNEPTFAPWYLSFDDFELKSAPLSAGEFQVGQLSFYPNPVKNTLNLSSAETISNVSVVNVLGQIVLSKQVNSTELTLDMSALNAGTYFVKVASANAQKTLKVIKQ